MRGRNAIACQEGGYTSWHRMSRHQLWYVCEYRNGNLGKAKEAAEAQYQSRSAETNIFQLDIYSDGSDESKH